jgi:3-oxoadipate enol-lactonase
VRIRLDGFDAYCEEHGSGPPLVLVHGLGGSTAMWQRVVDPLAERFRVVAYDLRGLGRSGTPEPPYTMDALVGDLSALADGLGLERFALVGHSLGGAVGLAFASQHPERLRTLVGISAPSITPEEQRAQLADRAEAAIRDGMDAMAEVHAQNGLPEAWRRAHAADVAVYKGIIAGSDPRGYAAHCAVIAALDLRDALGAIRAPALLVQGELDAVVPAEAVRATAAAIPGCEYVELPGCGHVVPFERPGDLAALVGDFASRHAPEA